MSEEKGGKLRDIKETASDAVEIMRELGTPGVQETFDKIREVAIIAKEIMETMKTPEWVENMNNIRLVSQNFNEASARMDNTVNGLRETGIIDDTKELIKAAKGKMDSFGGGEGGGVSGQDLKEVATTFKEMLESIKALVDELKLVAAESKGSGTIHNVEEAVKDTSDAYRTVRREVER
jgi:hypothetical protein